MKGRLLEFGALNETVVVRRADGRVVKFKIGLLSEEDQDYVRSRGPLLTAAKGLSVSADLDRMKSAKTQKGRWTQITTPYSYQIELENSLDKVIEGASIEYVIFCERNRKDSTKPAIERIEGSTEISMILAQDEENVTTTEIVLEEWSDNPPIPSGGRGGGG